MLGRMLDAIVSPPPPTNEPVLAYAPGSPERGRLKETLRAMSAETIEIPLVIDGKDVHTGVLEDVRAPHRHDLLLARAHVGGVEHARHAIAAAKRAHAVWSSVSWNDRAGGFL